MINRFIIISFAAACLGCIQLSATASSKLDLGTVAIQGNPIGRHDDYTINSTRMGATNVKCTFTNTGGSPVKLNIWTQPNQKRASASIYLKSASESKPAAASLVVSAAMQPHWWCRIYKPDPSSSAYRYCSYFSVSDATIVNYVPFSNFDKTIHSKDAHYSCSFKRTAAATFRFFYFK